MPRFSCQTVFAARIQPEEIAELPPPNMAPPLHKKYLFGGLNRGHAVCGAAPGDQNVCCEIKFLRSLRGRNSEQ